MTSLRIFIHSAQQILGILRNIASLIRCFTENLLMEKARF